MVKNKCKNFLKRNIIAGSGTAVALATVVLLFSCYYTCCFEFFVTGKSIGFSQSADSYEQIRVEVNKQISGHFGENACISEEATVVPRIIRRDDMTDYRTFFNNVAALSSYMTNAHILVIDGEEYVSFKSKEDMNTAVQTLVNEYGAGGELDIHEDIKETTGYVSVMNVYDAEAGVKYIKDNGLINADAVVMRTYTEPVVYEEQTVENPDMYEGERSIVQEGAEGEKTINEKVTFVNGTETAREIISETVTRQPVAQICSVGIKSLPDGMGTGSFIFPTVGSISSRFGSRWGREHDGIDIANSLGTDVYASDEGKVIFSGVQSGYGNIIIIDHGNSYTTKYAHCSELLKEVGDVVAKGDVIAKSGNTGRSTGNHLHFEICRDGEPLNPLDFVG